MNLAFGLHANPRGVAWTELGVALRSKDSGRFMDSIGKDIARAIAELSAVEARLLAFEDEHASALARVAPRHTASARNLLHYIGLRQHDIRGLQERLQALGVSSLDHAESHVLGSVQAVLAVLHRLQGNRFPDPEPAAGLPAPDPGPEVLHTRAACLFGPRPAHRGGRIMVTMPSEAAEDPGFILRCLQAGMNSMRINCAHDGVAHWARMVRHLHAAREATGLPCRIFMDLGGPKVRTGTIAGLPAVLRWKPVRDSYGRTTAPARIWLTPWQGAEKAPSVPAATLHLPAYWLAAVRPGDRIEFEDARGEARCIRVVERCGASLWGHCIRTAYVKPETKFRLTRRGRNVNGARGSWVTPYGIQRQRGCITVQPGDHLILTAEDRVAAPREHPGWGAADAPVLSCTLPEALHSVRTGEPVWFDDGKIGGTVHAVRDGEVEVRIDSARGGCARLHADRGINFPGSGLQLPALTNRDLDDLRFVAGHADVVGLSWVQSPSDVHELLARLRALGAEHVGVILKIETRRAFEALPDLLLAAMQDRAVGVMIARGDLAVECGWEQLAEIQEQILWLCEAAHVPVVWATQVLESLAKNGRPSRAEITDAAMSGRAECVMLNKGPHVVEAIEFLDRILERMAFHQTKRSPRLPRLQVWRRYEEPGAARAVAQGFAWTGGASPAPVAAIGTSRIESRSE